VRSPFWSISLIALVVLVGVLLNMGYWSLAAALFDTLIFGGAAIELLDGSVLLERSHVLGLPVLACVC